MFCPSLRNREILCFLGDHNKYNIRCAYASIFLCPVPKCWELNSKNLVFIEMSTSMNITNDGFISEFATGGEVKGHGFNAFSLCSLCSVVLEWTSDQTWWARVREAMTNHGKMC